LAVLQTFKRVKRGEDEVHQYEGKGLEDFCV